MYLFENKVFVRNLFGPWRSSSYSKTTNSPATFVAGSNLNHGSIIR